MLLKYQKNFRYCQQIQTKTGIIQTFVLKILFYVIIIIINSMYYSILILFYEGISD